MGGIHLLSDAAVTPTKGGRGKHGKTEGGKKKKQLFINWG